MLSTVVLPAPFGPIRLVTSPGAASNETSWTAFTPPKVIPRFLTSNPSFVRVGSSAPSLAGRERRFLENNRASAPTTPSGAIHSTASISPPKKSSRYSARPASTSGSSTTMAAPTSGPATEPAPPMTTASTKRIDCEKAKVDGVTKPESGAKSAPAAPAHTAEMANAAALIATGSRPIDSAAVSVSRTARIAAPHRLRASRQKPKVTTAARTMLRMATPRSPIAAFPMPGCAIPMIPFWPPVTLRHSTARCSTTKPKAMVTIARYGPFTRSAGSASSAPTRPESSAATGSASQKLHFAATVRTATV